MSFARAFAPEGHRRIAGGKPAKRSAPAGHVALLNVVRPGGALEEDLHSVDTYDPTTTSCSARNTERIEFNDRYLW